MFVPLPDTHGDRILLEVSLKELTVRCGIVRGLRYGYSVMCKPVAALHQCLLRCLGNQIRGLLVNERPAATVQYSSYEPPPA